ncbi:MAG: class I SAM-dependent methyltransferase [Chlamydiales bacterium]
MLNIFFLFLTFFGNLAANDWTIDSKKKGWSSADLVQTYFHNSELQRQWGWEAFAKLRLQGTEHVLDFGAGDGKLTAQIARLVPEGSVVGVDLSDQMVCFANKMFPFPNLLFVATQDALFSNMYFPEKFDLVTSFFTFHVIPDPVPTLQNIREHLQPNGTLLLCFTTGGNTEFFTAATQEMTERGWSIPPATENCKKMRNPDLIPQLLEEAGFHIERYDVVPSRFPFSTRQELAAWFEGTLCANWNIPFEQQKDFCEKLTSRYLELSPSDQDEDGFVYFRLRRVDIIATRK